MLTANQKEQILQVVRFGCDLATACDYVDCTDAQLQATLAKDAAFHSEYRRAAAGAEVHRMKVVNEAVGDVKNWRAATWWFERRDAERLGRQGVAALAEQLQAVLEQAGELVKAHVANTAERRQVGRRFTEMRRELKAIVNPPKSKKPRKR